MCLAVNRINTDVPLEAHEKSEVWLGCPDSARNCQVILQEVRCEVNELPKSYADAKMTTREIVFCANRVIVRGPVLLGKSLSTIGSRSKTNRATTFSQEGLETRRTVAGVGDISERELTRPGLRTPRK